MVIVSIDYGDKRTGVAVCDKNQILASPVCTIESDDKKVLIDKIIEIGEQKKAEIFVIGLPKNMDGSLGFRAEACKEFASELSAESGIECVFQDERLTTVSAHLALNGTNTRGKKRKEKIDQVSAVIILQDYIDSLRFKG